MSQEEHKSHAPASVRCFVLTVSDTRTDATDTGGRAIRLLLESAGHVVIGQALVRDDPEAVTSVVTRQLDRNGIDDRLPRSIRSWRTNRYARQASPLDPAIKPR